MERFLSSAGKRDMVLAFGIYRTIFKADMKFITEIAQKLQVLHCPGVVTKASKGKGLPFFEDIAPT